jgi:hypothetical protein
MSITAFRHIVIVILFVSTTGCTRPSASWLEEVELSDQRVITVSREQRWRTMHPPGASKQFLDDHMTLAIQTQSGELVAWEGTGEQPMLLDFEPSSGEYLLITLPSLCDRYRSLGEPEPPYVEYRLRGDKWVRVPFSEESIGRRPNLLLWPMPSGEVARVSIAQKHERNAVSGVSKQKSQIVGEGGLPGCPRLAGSNRLRKEPVSRPGAEP